MASRDRESYKQVASQVSPCVRVACHISKTSQTIAAWSGRDARELIPKITKKCYNNSYVGTVLDESFEIDAMAYVVMAHIFMAYIVMASTRALKLVPWPV